MSDHTTQLQLSVSGMSCASCVRRVEQALLKTPGVSAASVNLASERASVTIDAQTPVAEVLAALTSAGYSAHEYVEAREQEQSLRDLDIASQRDSLLIAALLTLPVFVLEMGSHLIPAVHHWVMANLGQQLNWIIQFILTSLVLFGPGRRFLQSGLPALYRKAPDMNSLVALGTLSAWSYSVVATFAGGLMPEGTRHVYFEAAAVIITLILLGRFLEARAKGKTGDAIKHLLGLQAKTAHVERNGNSIELPVDQVLVGDQVKLRPGDRIPVDGVVISGNSWVDESMLTGEPAPNAKTIDDTVTGGTINGNGTLTLQATRVGADSTLAQIIRMVEQAQGAKLPIQALVDRITAIFVPVVMAVALITFLIWIIFGPTPAISFALVNAVAVLIIACPCAMGLATPTSIMVGTGRAAELGVLFRKGQALQSLRDAKVIALDKTGTLTRGKPELIDFIVQPGFDAIETLTLVASAEQSSEHPMAQAIVQAAANQDIKLSAVSEFSAIPGMGVSATVNRHRVAVGAARFMESKGLSLTPATRISATVAAEGKTPLYATVDGELAAVITVEDALKTSTPDAIKAFHRLGLKVAIITGDNKHTAQAIASQLGIDDVVAEVLPDGKVDAIKALRAKYGNTAFVGDGINDAPALAEADIGIAVGTGSDVAIESAEVVLMGGDLLGVVNALAVSQATIRNIRQNLFWAFAYNICLIPVAAGVLYPTTGWLLSPILAAGAMAMSSVFVVTNALRLRTFKSAITA